jgi:hypothetical protein
MSWHDELDRRCSALWADFDDLRAVAGLGIDALPAILPDELLTTSTRQPPTTMRGLAR